MNNDIFKVGETVVICAKVKGLVKGNLGVITSIDGEYHYVQPYGRKKGNEVELYRNEMKKVNKR